MTLALKGEGGNRLSLLVGPLISALIAAGASVIGATYVTGQRTGAQDQIISGHEQRIGRLEVETKTEDHDRNNAASEIANKLGGLTAQVADLTRGLDRLEQRLDNGPPRQGGQ